MRFTIISLLCVIYLVFSASVTSVAAENALAHHFFHANLFHLAGNALVIWYLLRRWRWGELVSAYIIATISHLLSPVPVVGFSNMIYAICGLRTPSFKSSWWKRPTTIVFLSVTAIMFLVPGMSALTHIIALGAGICVSAVRRWIKGIIDDCKRYTCNI